MYRTESSIDQPDYVRYSSSLSGSSLTSSSGFRSTQSATLSEIEQLLQQDLTPNKRAIINVLLTTWNSRHIPQAYIGSSHLQRAS